MEITEEAKSEIDKDEKKRSFCKKWNIPVALDDYGSGYSNSDILVSRIFHFVKLDMSLIHNIDKNQSTQSLVKSIIEYCHENSLMVIAEGVETEAEFEKSKELGADFVQGFYFAKPSYVLYNNEIEQP
jgi:EAL domain-containing protein (putative c-di-GMP-specific phosphodiesterase class I)